MSDSLSPQCFNPGCDKQFDSVNDMVAIPGRSGRSPRHFCEECAERIQRGPPMVDDGQDAPDHDVPVEQQLTGFGSDGKLCGHPPSLTYPASDGTWRCSVCNDPVKTTENSTRVTQQNSPVSPSQDGDRR